MLVYKTNLNLALGLSSNYVTFKSNEAKWSLPLTHWPTKGNFHQHLWEGDWQIQKEISVPKQTQSSPANASLLFYPAEGIWENYTPNLVAAGRSNEHEWKLWENLLASIRALHLRLSPGLRCELSSTVLCSALCTSLLFLLSIRIYLERWSSGTDTTSAAEWIHWGSYQAQHSSPGSDTTLHPLRTGSSLIGQSFPGLGGREEGV